MRIFVTVKTRAKKESVEQMDPTHFVVAVKEAPVQAKANQAVLRALARYLKLAPSRLQIISGHTSRHKILRIADG